MILMTTNLVQAFLTYLRRMVIRKEGKFMWFYPIKYRCDCKKIKCGCDCKKIKYDSECQKIIYHSGCCKKEMHYPCECKNCYYQDKCQDKKYHDYYCRHFDKDNHCCCCM